MNGRLRARRKGLHEDPLKQAIPPMAWGGVGDNKLNHPGSGQLLVGQRLALPRQVAAVRQQAPVVKVSAPTMLIL